jgi:hypothetical protein
VRLDTPAIMASGLRGYVFIVAPGAKKVPEP